MLPAASAFRLAAIVAVGKGKPLTSAGSGRVAISTADRPRPGARYAELGHARLEGGALHPQARRRATGTGEDERMGKALGADALAEMGNGLRVAEEVLKAHVLSVEHLRRAVEKGRQTM